jgi:hypothetical protein
MLLLDQDNCILKKKIGYKMLLKPKGRGAYVMDVEFVGGGKTVITVASGTEESVCQRQWGEKLFGTADAGGWVTFKIVGGIFDIGAGGKLRWCHLFEGGTEGRRTTEVYKPSRS